MFKTIHKTLPPGDKTEWLWPVYDTELIKVFDYVADIDIIMKHVDVPSVCVQAGGAVGLWPYRFAHFFTIVYTFEPLWENYSCLLLNCESEKNIVSMRRPLSDVSGQRVAVCHDASESTNCGAGYISPSEDGVKTIRIDDLGIKNCDLIQLDIEGHELKALRGAYQTILKFHPTIVLEEKRLPHMPADWNYAEAREWLQDEFGYKVVGSVHRDIILK